MEPRSAIHARFVARFHSGAPQSPVSEDLLDEVERGLSTALPTAYREFMTRHGIVHTPRLLELLSARDLDHPDVQDFLAPSEAISNTQNYWSAGMPADVIGIASDCMGNMIGFRRQSVRSDDSPVVFFDHDYVDVRDIAASFDEFLLWYLDHL
jgi:hypothetical protein